MTSPRQIAFTVGRLVTRSGLTIATAESCTGGLLGGALTAVPGASNWYLGGLVTYSNQLKQQLLGVPAEVLENFGAVSRECALAMAVGTRNLLGADLAVAITGIAGPTGGSPGKPVGTVYLALAAAAGATCAGFLLTPPRSRIRREALTVALVTLRDWLGARHEMPSKF